MTFAAKETIRHILMMLPSSSQTLLHGQGFRELANLLKLINTNNHTDTLLPSYPFRQVQDFLWRIILRSNP